MLKRLMRTQFDAGMLLLRVGLGLVVFPHGAQKALGLFGGPGFNATVASFEQNYGIPAVVTGLVIAAEFLGAVGLVLGFFGRVAALGIAVVMVGTIQMFYLKPGFLTNWFSMQEQGHPLEFRILVLAAALVILIKGSGALSFDRMLGKTSER
ncbi:MAG: DoxX family protein [Planctomycetes bacterium]|nr:DoxX family protein [Planctomycetota bacterium]